MAGNAESPLLTGPLALATRLVVRFPRFTLAVALIAALASVAFSVTALDIRTKRLDLLNPESGYNKLWIEYIRDFGEQDDTVVVVEGKDPQQVQVALDQLAVELKQRNRFFESIFWKLDLSGLQSKQLYYASAEEIEAIESFVQQVEPIVQGNWSGLNFSSMATRLAMHAATGQPGSRRSAERFRRHADNLRGALAGGQGYQSPWDAISEFDEQQARFDEPEYLVSRQGRLGVLLLRLVERDEGLAEGSAAIDNLRTLLADFSRQYPKLSFGLTGLPVMENDEMRASQQATVKASVISLIGVACLFIAGFGGIRHPLLTVATLVLAICWSFGYVTAVIGHLNILSMSFGVILIGLGIDFGIHYVARYLQLRKTIDRSDQALRQTAVGVGPGIVTGGATTAIAFFAAGLTDFTGVAELGIIAGGGILLCIVSAIFVLPALIHLMDRGRVGESMPLPLPVERPLTLVEQVPHLVMGVSLVVIVFSASGIGRLWYDHNLLNLQPYGLQSVQLEQRLLDETDHSVWYALSLAETRSKLLDRKRKFDALESVERTEEIASLLPLDADAKQSRIARIHEQLKHLPQEPPLIRVDSPRELREALQSARSQLVTNEANAQIIMSLDALLTQLNAAGAERTYRSVSQYQQRLAGELIGQLRSLQAIANPDPPSLADLPPGLVDRFVGDSGSFLLKVYSKTNIWDMDALAPFVQQVRQVDPRATGKPLQTYEASRHMLRSYVHAALYALIAVTMLLMIDFRSLRYSLLALIPVGLGMLQLFGLLGMLGIPLNPANMIVLPLILGIGLDDGVHVIHDFRTQRGPYRLSRSTATAVLLTSLTTMVGFGSLMLADHRGLQSLGRVLTIGVSCCLFTSLVPLPALLSWMTRNRRLVDDPAANGLIHEAHGSMITRPAIPLGRSPEFQMDVGVDLGNSPLSRLD